MELDNVFEMCLCEDCDIYIEYADVTTVFNK